MRLFSKITTYKKEALAGAAIFGGATIAIQLLVVLSPKNFFDLPWLLGMLLLASTVATHVLLKISGSAWLVGICSGSPLKTLFVTTLVNGTIGALCGMLTRASLLWIRTCFNKQ